MKYVEIAGDDLRRFLDEVKEPHDDIRTIRIAVEEDGLKIKVNEYSWSSPIGIVVDAG